MEKRKAKMWASFIGIAVTIISLLLLIHDKVSPMALITPEKKTALIALQVFMVLFFIGKTLECFPKTEKIGIVLVLWGLGLMAVTISVTVLMMILAFFLGIISYLIRVKAKLLVSLFLKK